MASEERASGISPEMTELDEALENIFELMEEESKTRKGMDKNQEENQKLVAEAIRKRSMKLWQKHWKERRKGQERRRKDVMLAQI